jgi:PHD/YefM family antitoxin component YafN of YafNO toxin-antitoxin module
LLENQEKEDMLLHGIKSDRLDIYVKSKQDEAVALISAELDSVKRERDELLSGPVEELL